MKYRMTFAEALVLAAILAVAASCVALAVKHRPGWQPCIRIIDGNEWGAP